MAAQIALLGAGVTGDRIAKRLALIAPQCRVVHIDPRGDTRAARSCDVAILAQGGSQVDAAQRLVEMGVPVVSITDRVDDVRELGAMHDAASSHGVPLVVGGGMSAGLTGLLARHLVSQLHHADEIHIAVHGTAGPSCARQHHRALAGRAFGVHDGERITRAGGSGRELCWFPEPVGAYDCYRAELSAPVLFDVVFPQVTRISARVSANRRDRLTARLPMLRRPHPEGGVGAVRVEVRGSVASGARVTLIAGVAEMVGTSAAATATALAGAILDGTVPAGVICPGDERLDTLALLHTIERLGVRLQEFTGVPHVPKPTPHDVTPPTD
jgi:hypothetical protein